MKYECQSRVVRDNHGGPQLTKPVEPLKRPYVQDTLLITPFRNLGNASFSPLVRESSSTLTWNFKNMTLSPITKRRVGSHLGTQPHAGGLQASNRAQVRAGLFELELGTPPCAEIVSLDLYVRGALEAEQPTTRYPGVDVIRFMHGREDHMFLPHIPLDFAPPMVPSKFQQRLHQKSKRDARVPHTQYCSLLSGVLIERGKVLCRR